MSTSESPVASSSSSGVYIADASKSEKTRYQFTIPTRFLLIPPSAVTLGLIIGMFRGGRRARLRFIAENAHRQPRTYQGWYFYAKTRNYRMIYQGTLAGGKTALQLGTMTTAYVFIDEYWSYLREEVLGVVVPKDTKFKEEVTWRSGGTVWYDGTVTGTVTAVGVGLIYRLPKPLAARILLLGAMLGTVDSWGRVMNSRMAAKIQAAQKAEAESEAEKKPEPEATAVVAAPTLPNHPIVDRDPQPSPPAVPTPLSNTSRSSTPSALPELEDLVSVQSKNEGWWDKAKSWIPGL